MTRTVLESKTKTVVIGFDEPFCVIGERINPTGRKKLAAELEAGNFETVIKDALEQVACGATVLDINSGAVFTNKMAQDPRYADNNFVEPPLMKALVEIVQQTVDVPLCIDSSVPGALEAGLAAGDATAATSWLRENLQRHGGLREPATTIQAACGFAPDEGPLLDYLEAKFRDIYAI